MTEERPFDLIRRVIERSDNASNEPIFSSYKIPVLKAKSLKEENKKKKTETKEKEINWDRLYEIDLKSVAMKEGHFNSCFIYEFL